MNLIIDMGNTLIKLAVFSNGALTCKEITNQNDLLSRLENLKLRYSNLSKAILSSVGKLTTSEMNRINSIFEVHVLDFQTNLPFTNLYQTPATLGVDRMALASAAVCQFPYKNVLVIDAGTCITYDFISTEKEYRGGAISAGLTMRYKALNAFTSNLPLLEPETPIDVIGVSTNTAIHSGVVYGVLAEMEGLIDRYQQKYTDLTVILTGGDAKFLSKQLKSSIFALPNFLLEGLDYILQFNTNA